jgi:hypothetical protein
MTEAIAIGITAYDHQGRILKDIYFSEPTNDIKLNELNLPFETYHVRPIIQVPELKITGLAVN